MKKRLVCIFAHPDDEAFGPSGTIATFAKTHDVYLICVTDGAAGENLKNYKDLGKVRQDEARAAAKILGVKETFCLSYADGSLCNNLYHEVSIKIQQILDKIKPETLLTVEHRGVSGHLDHIAVSMISSYLFERLAYIKRILYHCLRESQRSRAKDYFIFFPPGYRDEEIDEVIDVSDVWGEKLEAIKCHESQVSDLQAILEHYRSAPKKEYFLSRVK